MSAGTIRNLTWKLNWFRQSELEGALLIGRMVGTVRDRELAARLTKHCAEEAEHSRLWSEVIAGLGLPHVRIFRSYQSLYLRHGGGPSTLLEVLCFTQIFERRVHQRFHEELRRTDLPLAVRRAFARMIKDEKEHLAWVAAWLRSQPGASDALRRYEQIDRAVYAEFQSFEQCLWKIPGLGRECSPAETAAAI